MGESKERGVLKVTLLSKADGGGAGIAARRLHDGLLGRGVDSRMLVQSKTTGDPSIDEFRPSRSRWRHAMQTVRWFAMNAEKLGGRPDPVSPFEFYSSSRSLWGPEVLQRIRQSDVVNLHWIAEYVDFGLLGRLAKKWPLVWTLHDLNPLTGGCHFDDGCGGFASACGICPHLPRRLLGGRSARAMRRKGAALRTVRSDRLAFVAPSTWMAEQVRRSSLLGGFGLTVIPYGIEARLFGAVERSEARRRLGIRDDRIWFLFVADWLMIRRKGADLVMGVESAAWREAGAGLLLCGRGLNEPMPSHVLGLGPKAEADMAIVYSAADAVIVPSRQDNFPNVILEAMASGRPVIGANVGGIPEMVADGVDGLLFQGGDVDALGRAMREMASSEERRRSMGEAARRKVGARYALGEQADAYTRLFRRILEESGRSSAEDGLGEEPAS